MQSKALLKIKSLVVILGKANFSCSPITKKNYNYETSLIKNSQKNKLQVYFGKKGVKVVIQGSTGSDEYNELNKIIFDKSTLPPDNDINKDYDIYIGTDETGKGDYFGPLVIAAMYVDTEIQEYLRAIGVKDSKELSDTQIDRIAEKIKNKYPNLFNIVLIIPEKYNELYEVFNNLNKLLNWGHSKVIENLLIQCSCKTIITDQFSKAPLNISSNSKYEKINFVQMPKAEKYVGVAAASILARNAMNNWFREMASEGFNIPKGASNEVEISAKHIYNNYGFEILNKFVKLHFKTTKKILIET